jgi:hypothetical protein
VYEDGLGELVSMDSTTGIVTIRLKTNRKWHDSYTVAVDKEKVTIGAGRDHFFSAADIAFTLRRIQALGSLSPDYILVSQAFDPITFEGPDAENQIRFRFRPDRLWKEADIKEVLSFKILPANADMNAVNYANGTAPYMSIPPLENTLRFHASPDGQAAIPWLNLAPFVDNSTYATELHNSKINVLLETPFGSLSPILEKQEDFFVKSNISTTFFALLLNTERLTREQRGAVRSLINAQAILNRFYKVGTPQQRHIVDYKGNRDNYSDYINYSIFPSSSYYIEEEIIQPAPDSLTATLVVLPDTLQIRTCVNYGFREELTEMIEILNDPTVTKGKVRARAIQNDEIRRGEYDALLVAVSGYRSNFLFDLYDVFLREPDYEVHAINLQTNPNQTVSPASFQVGKNFFRLDPDRNTAERDDILTLLSDVHGFMSTRQVGDRQEYARRVDADERRMNLGVWLFSLPSLAYFSTQFDSTSISLYGVASQLSTIEQWRERKK